MVKLACPQIESWEAVIDITGDWWSQWSLLSNSLTIQESGFLPEPTWSTILPVSFVIYTVLCYFVVSSLMMPQWVSLVEREHSIYPLQKEFCSKTPPGTQQESKVLPCKTNWKIPTLCIFARCRQVWPKGCSVSTLFTDSGRRINVHVQSLALTLAKMNIHYLFCQDMATASFQQRGCINTWYNRKPNRHWATTDIVARANNGGSTRGKNGEKTLTCCQEQPSSGWIR